MDGPLGICRGEPSNLCAGEALDHPVGQPIHGPILAHRAITRDHSSPQFDHPTAHPSPAAAIRASTAIIAWGPGTAVFVPTAGGAVLGVVADVRRLRLAGAHVAVDGDRVAGVLLEAEPVAVGDAELRVVLGGHEGAAWRPCESG